MYGFTHSKENQKFSKLSYISRLTFTTNLVAKSSHSNVIMAVNTTTASFSTTSLPMASLIDSLVLILHNKMARLSERYVH